MHRSGHNTTSGVKFDDKVDFSMPEFLHGRKFWKLDHDFMSFSQFSTAHAQKRPKIFYFRSHFNPKFEIPMGCLVTIWIRILVAHFSPYLCVFWAKNGFCNANISEFGGQWGCGWSFFTNPKRHILGWFHAFWAIMRADQFTRFYTRRSDEKRDTTKSHRKVIFHLFAGNSPPN